MSGLTATARIGMGIGIAIGCHLKGWQAKYQPSSARGTRSPPAMWHREQYTLFFYKNKVYKNVKPQLVSKTKNILHAEMDLKSQLFLIVLCKPQKWIRDLCS